MNLAVPLAGDPGLVRGWRPWAVKLAIVQAAGADTDAELVERARQGDRDAFETLVRRHVDRVHSVALRMLGDPGDAAEATQEAFLRAWRGIRGFKQRSEFSTWLFRIAINEANRIGARRGNERVRSHDDPNLIERVADSSEAPERRFAQRELRSVLEAAVRSLPERYRAPLILRDIEGLTTKQAAAVMELREAAFKSRLHRARLQVRGAIDDYLEGGE